MSPDVSRPTKSPEFESVRILRLEPGDEIVLKIEGRVYGAADVEHLKKQAEDRWPGHRVTVVSDIDLTVVRR